MLPVARRRVRQSVRCPPFHLSTASSRPPRSEVFPGRAPQRSFRPLRRHCLHSQRSRRLFGKLLERSKPAVPPPQSAKPSSAARSLLTFSFPVPSPFITRISASSSFTSV